MQLFNLADMTNGWFVGGFNPTVLFTTDVEVAVKYYKAGDSEEPHYHKIATELTVIVSGEVRMNGVNYSSGSIILIEPYQVTDFTAITDVTTTVVKFPGARDDKYKETQK